MSPNGFHVLILASILLAPALAQTLKLATPSPVPTSPPHPRDVLNAFKRQQFVSETRTCFYVDGSPSSALTCDINSACAYDHYTSAFGCCSAPLDGDACQVQASCVDFSDIHGTSDTETVLYCTQSAFGLCQKYTYITGSDAFSGWGCGTAHTTFNLQATATGLVGDGFFASALTSAAVTGTSVGGHEPIATSSANFSAVAGGSSASAGSQNTGLSTGAIAGIAIAAALVIITAMVIGAVMVWRRRKEKQNAAAIVRPQSHNPGYSQKPYEVTDVSPLNPENLDSHLADQWVGMKPSVPQSQSQSASRLDDDGLSHKPELRPQDAAGEPRYEVMSQVYSDAGRTALHPASESLWPQRA